MTIPANVYWSRIPGRAGQQVVEGNRRVALIVIAAMAAVVVEAADIRHTRTVNLPRVAAAVFLEAQLARHPGVRAKIDVLDMRGHDQRLVAGGADGNDTFEIE